MANPSADFPSAIHTPIDVSAFTASKLGSTTPTHTALEGKQEAEVVAVQTKLGTGSSTPTAGKILKGTGTGTSAWAAVDIDWGNPVAIDAAAALTFGKHHVISDSLVPADYDVTLPEITASDYGKQISVYISQVSTKRFGIAAFSGQTIDGVATRYFFSSESVILLATTEGWVKIGGKNLPLSAVVYPSTQFTHPLTSWVAADGFDTGYESKPCGMYDGTTTPTSIKIRRSGKYLVEFSILTFGNISLTEFEIIISEGPVFSTGMLCDVIGNLSSSYKECHFAFTFDLAEGKSYRPFLYINSSGGNTFYGGEVNTRLKLTQLIDY